jgi:predicted Zn finger-like uncharacterized protein
MSLATRCVACGTVFRVVQDQLKVSEGWVRCGRCDEVFNAIESLFDLERDAPPGWKPPPAPAVPTAAVAAAAFDPPEAPPGEDADIAELSEDDRIHSRFFQPEQADVDQSPADHVAAQDRVEFADARFNDEMLLDAPEETHAMPLESQAMPLTPKPRIKGKKSRVRAGLDAAKAEPDFVRLAKERARWSTPAARLTVVIAGVVLASALVAQVAIHQRDIVAAKWPATRTALVAACGWLRCRVEAPKHINEITVESSSLSPANGGSYRLSLSLRNRGSTPVAMPSIDLSITDSSGQLIARRALSPADFRVGSPVIPADSEAPLQLLLAATGARLSGYTVEVFYP